MYSFLPASISILYLSYGFYALASQGINRVSASFFLVCLTTFFWQSTWAVLFQIKDPTIAHYLIKFGYFFILFLPSSVYYFLSEICGLQKERCYVYLSYGLAALLGVCLLSSDLFVSGYYSYYWGYYPKAGVLHPVHVLQTFFVVGRGLYVNYIVLHRKPQTLNNGEPFDEICRSEEFQKSLVCAGFVRELRGEVRILAEIFVLNCCQFYTKKSSKMLQSIRHLCAKIPLWNVTHRDISDKGSRRCV